MNIRPKIMVVINAMFLLGGLIASEIRLIVSFFGKILYQFNG